jgi:hypothetical protein
MRTPQRSSRLPYTETFSEPGNEPPKERFAPYIPRTPLLACHVRGDWGEVSPKDIKGNDFSLKHGILYNLNTGVNIWVSTEADRSSSLVLLPDEY